MCSGPEPHHVALPVKPILRTRDSKPWLFRFEDVKASTNGFSSDALICKSSPVSIYKAVLGDERQVTVKRALSGPRYYNGQVVLSNELEILSKVHGDHLLNLVGHSADSDERILVMEATAYGTLDNVLQNSKPIGWPLRVHLAFQIASAINANHVVYPPLIHRDIKSSHIWVNEDWSVKIGGFGIARRVCISDSLPPPLLASIAALDPTIPTDGHICTKTDVFCFGALLLEIISSQKPFDVSRMPGNIIDWALPLIKKDRVFALCDRRLQLPFKKLHEVKRLADIAVFCLNPKSSERPSMGDVVSQLRIIRSKFAEGTKP